MHLSFDTPFDPDFPVYTRANAGEILPHSLSPMTWSLMGSAFEEGFRIAFADDCGAVSRPGPDRPFQMVGRFAGRFHLNLSVIRTVGERLPGTSAAAVDAQYMGDASATGLPEHESDPDDRKWRLKAAPAMGRTMASMGRRVDRDAEAVAELVGTVDELLEADTDPADLVRATRAGVGVCARLLGSHITARALTSPILEQATNAVQRSGVAAEESLQFIADIPDLESSKPSRALAKIATTVESGSPLAALVAAGDLEELSNSPLPGAANLAAAIDEFLVDFGHRGVGEYDPVMPVWRQRPEEVLHLLDALITTGPVLETERTAEDPGRLARQVVAAARSAMHRAERTKDHAIRATGAIRRLLFATGAALDLEPATWQLLTINELETIAHGGAPPAADELRRRGADLLIADQTDVAEWSDGSLRLADAADTPNVDSITGIAGSPGIVTGRVRVMQSPSDPFEDGEVLVVSMTDTAWTPLFLAAAAVVTDVGGVLSHATIVARDLGIPAVVNTKLGTRALHDGDLVEVDGGAGTVKVTEKVDKTPM